MKKPIKSKSEDAKLVSAYQSKMKDNAQEVLASKTCGCPHCGLAFPTGEITDWAEDRNGSMTALCPHCGFADVVPEASGLDLSEETFRGYDILFVEGYLVQNHAFVQRAMELGHAAGMKICLDMASYNIVEADRDFLRLLVDRYVDILFANEDEARAFTCLPEQEAIDDLARRCEVAVVKVGPRGAYIRRGEEQVHVPAKEVPEVVDTNAAGDYFAAGFLYGYVRRLPLLTCGRIGSELSGGIIRVVGTKLSEEVWNEIKLNIEAILSE